MSLEQTIDNLQIRNANMVTFVGTSNTMVDTTTGRIQTKGIQHNSNVITDVSGPHGRGVATLKKYPEMIFEDEKVDRNDTTNTYTQAGYTISTDSVYGDRQVYKAFSTKGGEGSTTAHVWSSEDVGGNGYVLATGDPISGVTFQDENGTSYTGHYIKLELPKKIKLNSISFKSQKNTYNSTNNDKRPTSGTFLGSNDGTNWVLLKTFNEGQLSWSGGLVSGATTDYVYSTTLNNIVSDGYFSYILFVIETIGNNNEYGPTEVRDLKYYGYEEDPPAGDHSVDTTFKSRFNNPQLTGVQVLVDGATGVGTNQISGGPDPSGNQSTYVTDGKYWTLNGTLTSNLSVEANTFLEGDQPHAVSVWFNSSNLEANVSNTCVFSIASEEKLDSVNLDLQSNTWHNLTYSYQGEGGSRVTYLDGRKVSDDQAEDTFGAYPPFDMTEYSQGGYVVSASSDYTSDSNNLRKAYELYTFGSGANDGWMTEFGTFNPNAVSGDTFIDSDGGTHTGHFNKLKLPYKLKLSYFYYNHYGIFNSSRNANNWVILGSNNDSDWDLLHGSTTVLNATKHIPITATKGYTYLMFLCKSVNADTALFMGEIRYYGRRENDLVRLPDPTNVLKYPHIIINEPAKRGYVVSSSTQSVPPHTTGSYQAYNIFDGKLVFDGGNSNTPPNGTAWISLDSKYDGSGNPTGTAASTNVIGQSPVATPGEWFQLELPHKVKLSSIRVMGQTNNTTELAGRSPVDAVLAGSNNGTTWTTVLTYTGASWTTLSEFKSFPANVDSTNAYKYFRFIVTKNGGQQWAAIQEFEFYGTGVDSIPIQIGGGNIDKVANFRVYDRFIGEDQVNEIWNAQKEEFGRAKPQMVLQQGKLGIGTDAPQGSLSVADEPHNLEEFPPRAMTGYKNYFEGHGEFCVSASSTYHTLASGNGHQAYGAFDRQKDSDDWAKYTWNSAQNSYDTTSKKVVSGASLGGYAGEWIKLESPYKIKFSSYTITIRAQWYAYAPSTWYVVGSNDDEAWDTIGSESGITFTSTIGGNHLVIKKFNINTVKYYKYIAFVTSTLAGTGVNNLNIAELKYFGTREQGQSVLHDGQLTLTKNLNVPRIGTDLDADDTPRRDRLVVEYNTSTNPTFEGAVRDTSGRGNDGKMHGNVGYDPSDKAFTFDGVDDMIDIPIPRFMLGDPELTVSLWVKPQTIPSGSWDMYAHVGRNYTNQQVQLTYYDGSGGLHIGGYGQNIQISGGYTLNPGTWYHLCMTIQPGAWSTSTKKLYVNGYLVSGQFLHNSGTTNISDDDRSRISFGGLVGEGRTIDHEAHCFMSNMKVYDTALTAEEVKTLYDMGRTGSVANPQPLHIAAPLYAPGASIQTVSSTKTDTSLFSGTSITDISGLSVTIQPKFANSKICVYYHILYGGWGRMFFRVKRIQGSSTSYFRSSLGPNDHATTSRATTSDAFDNNDASTRSGSFFTLDDANGLQPITYTVEGWTYHATYYVCVNRGYREGNAGNESYHGRGVSSITAQEVCQ